MRDRISLRKQSCSLHGAKNMSNLATLVRSKLFRVLMAPGDNGFPPPSRIVSPISPRLHGLPQVAMIRIGDGRHASATPFGFDLLGKTAVEGIEPRPIILPI